MKKALLGLAIVGMLGIGFSASASQTRDEIFRAEQHAEAVEIVQSFSIDSAVIDCLRSRSSAYTEVACAQVTAYYAIKEGGTHEPSE